MRTKKRSITVSLPALEYRIIRTLMRRTRHGWFSQYISDKIRQDFVYPRSCRADVVRILKGILADRNVEAYEIEAQRQEILKEILKVEHKEDLLQVKK